MAEDRSAPRCDSTGQRAEDSMQQRSRGQSSGRCSCGSSQLTQARAAATAAWRSLPNSTAAGRTMRPFRTQTSSAAVTLLVALTLLTPLPAITAQPPSSTPPAELMAQIAAGQPPASPPRQPPSLQALAQPEASIMPQPPPLLGGNSGSNGPPLAEAPSGSPDAAPWPDSDAFATEELQAVVFNNATAALQWFNSPGIPDERNGTTVAHCMTRVWGPQTIARCAEVNYAFIEAAKEALVALQLEFRSRYVVEQYTNGSVPGFPQAKNFQAFDLFYSVYLKQGVPLKGGPLTAEVVQLINAYILHQLQEANLASGMMLLGVSLLDAIFDTATVGPAAEFQSVLKVTTADLGQLVPFVVERQTLLLSVLHGLNNNSSPIVCINVTAPRTSHMTSDFPSGRKLLGQNNGFIYIGVDMLVVPSGPDPAQVFSSLLGDGRYEEMLASSGLPVTLQWVNTTAVSYERMANGQTGHQVTLYPELSQPRHRGSHRLGNAAIVGIVIGATAAALLCLTGLFALSRWQSNRDGVQPSRRQAGSSASVKVNGSRHGSERSSASRHSAGEPGETVAAKHHVDSASSFRSVHGRSPLRSRLPDGVPSLETLISADEIQICQHDDGRLWLLGTGSFGDVYKAKQNGVHDVAVKKLRQGTTDAQWFGHLQHEIAILSKVSHNKNIVQYYGACLDHVDVNPDTAMLVMEYCSGGDLRQAMARDEAGDLMWLAGGRSLVLDIARGLHYLHSKGVMHRDLKASNILLTGEGVAKISDCGLATVMTAADPASWDKTAGTFCYASPELILGVRVTTAVDIYSFGVVLWEICTHEMPIRGQLRDVEVPDEAPAAISELIDECLQPNPAKRPSALAICERIQALPVEPRRARLQRISGPLAANLGRDNGQRWTGSEGGSSGRIPMVKRPGMVDSESLLRSLYSC